MENQITKITQSNQNRFSLSAYKYLGILLIITCFTLLGCEETNSPSVYTRSTTSNGTSQNVDTDTEVSTNSSIDTSSKCKYSQQVENIIDQLSDNPNLINIEISKQAYLKLKFYDSCSLESQRLGMNLKAHWTKSSFDYTLAEYTMCIANCLGSENNSCSESCEQERSQKIDSENEAIRSFFR